MNTQELEKEKMDTMTLLANTNMEISKAKSILFKLQEDETVYLGEREKKALDRINKVLEDSQGILNQAHSNYQEIESLCKTVSSFVAFLSEGHEKFSQMLVDFNVRCDEWDKMVSEKEAGFAEIDRKQKVLQTEIDNDKKWIAKAFKKIEEENALISSRQQQIKVALKVLEKKQNNG